MPDKHRILVVDDEPDVHAVTQLALRGMRYAERDVELAFASSGRECIEQLRAQPDTAVVLLDVVMESRTAGLEACRTIRGELALPLVRILLRTGQPGVAPERRVIDEYDIDGYLSKADLTAGRLYAAVRTAIKAFLELSELERHRRALASLHDSVVALHAFDPLATTARRIVATALELAPSACALLDLTTFAGGGEPERLRVCLAGGETEDRARALGGAVAEKIASDPEARARTTAGPWADGWLVPIALHRELGHGWIYLSARPEGLLAEQALVLLGAHAANALYASAAQAMLEGREGPFYDQMTV
jgi:CheY-like chemotaxis protein